MDIQGFIKEEGEAAQLRQLVAKYLAHAAAVRDNWLCIVWCKDALARDEKWEFLEVWQEMSHDTHKALWLATTKGGIWTTAERAKMREWGA